MGSLTQLTSSGQDDQKKGPSSYSSWLIAIGILSLVSILLVAFLLVYVTLYSVSMGTPNLPVLTEQSLRAARLADGLTSKAVLEILERVPTPFKARGKRSPLTSSASTFVEGLSDPSKMFFRRYDNNLYDSRQVCRKRSLAMCSGQVPYNSTAYPNFIGDESEEDANRSLAYFNYVAKSRCNRRIKQLLCAILEPACDAGHPVPPCKKFCRIALEGCAEYIPATLELSAAFDCRRYPDSSDPAVCLNLAMGNGCHADEFHCPDRSCIPSNWVCDGVRDCPFAADEAKCQGVSCSVEEFQCDRKCVPASWRCDGDRDCADGTDEANCSYKPGCGPDRFKCTDGFGCIPKRWVCDGKAECRDGSDEVGCSQRACTRGDFKCDNGICIPQIWRCDGQDDCKDNSDERSCQAGLPPMYQTYTSPPAQPTAPPAQMMVQASEPRPQYQAQPQPQHRPQQQVYRQQPQQRPTAPPRPQNQNQHQAGYPTNHRPPFTAFGNFYGQHNNVYRYRLFK